jgi:predicted kinase
MFALARECLRAGTDLVLEGNFRPGEHEQTLQALILDLAVEVAQVLCRTTESVRIERLQARATDLSRHPGHRDVEATTQPPQPTDDFLALPGERLVFDSDVQSAAAVDAARLQALLDALDRWHRAAGSR